ncbi:MAG: DUF1579 family protein [Planctomycetota bacterium]|nr:DUF1579 family protein [Planctomycetota bacterium]
MEYQMPTPGPAHEVLARMAGEWTGDETMLPSPFHPEEQKRTSTNSARMLEGFFLVSDYEQRSGDEVTFRGHGVYSWDAAAEEYVMYWFDSMGGAGGVARGKLEGDVLTFQSRSPMGHHRYRYTIGDGGYRFEMAMSQDGQDWPTFMEGTYSPS